MSNDDLSGRTLGRYELVERLGTGGMADVYRAYQPHLDRYVAIKVLHQHLVNDSDLLARFEREARSVATLRHPHIVQIFDFDVQHGRPFMVMEFISGPTLLRILLRLRASGRLMPYNTIGRIFAQLAAALEYAHERGVVHRDVKPANVMLRTTRTGALTGDVVLTDFGIARITGGAKYTATGTALGTPAYMAPEQGRGQHGDARSDIYSLGVMLYELLTGRVPYEADTPFALVLKHIKEPLPPIRARRPDLPIQFEHVVVKALEKDPGRRFQQASEFAQALNQVFIENAAPQGGVAPSAKVIDPRGTAILPAEEPVDEVLTMVAQSADPRGEAPTTAPASDPAHVNHALKDEPETPGTLPAQPDTPAAPAHAPADRPGEIGLLWSGRRGLPILIVAGVVVLVLVLLLLVAGMLVGSG